MLKSGLKSNLNEGLQFKNEVKSITSLQLGSRYGFVVEIDSPFGRFFCPLEGYRTKEQAFQVLKGRLK